MWIDPLIVVTALALYTALLFILLAWVSRTYSLVQQIVTFLTALDSYSMSPMTMKRKTMSIGCRTISQPSPPTVRGAPPRRGRCGASRALTHGTMKLRMATKKGTGLLMVWAVVPADREREFNRWYDEEHLAERISVPGFLSAARYEAVTGLACYELDTVAVLESEAYKRVQAHPTERTRRCFPEVIGTTDLLLDVGLRCERERLQLVAHDSSLQDRVRPLGINHLESAVRGECVHHGARDDVFEAGLRGLVLEDRHRDRLDMRGEIARIE